MTPELQRVLEIAGVGSTLLFLTLGGLVAFMYVLTSPPPRPRAAPKE